MFILNRSSGSVSPHTSAKFLRERVKRLDDLGYLFTRHSSPTEINKSALTPNSRRRCHHPRHLHLLFCRRLHLPRPRLLPRRALVAGWPRQLAKDQEGPSSG